MRILADATLPGLEHAFPKPWRLHYYSNQNELESLLEHQDVLVCRSTLKVCENLIKNHRVKYIATASSGTDHLDHAFLNARKIEIIDAKGANAPSVADYVMASLAFLFQNHLIKGHDVGIIGMGAVGSIVSNRLQSTGFNIKSYDPLKAQSDLQFKSATFEDLLSCDILCIHAELHDSYPFPSLNLIDANLLNALKPGCIIINAARGGIVNEAALLKNDHIIYCTDVYLNEPHINPRIIERATLCTPHIAGHSIEAKLAAVAMISKKLHEIYGLQVPQWNLNPHKPPIMLDSTDSWKKSILCLYNPFEETQQLKHARDKTEGFLNIRKRHNYRHDFSYL